MALSCENPHPLVRSYVQFQSRTLAGGTVNWGNNVVWNLPQTHKGYAIAAKVSGATGTTQWASYYSMALSTENANSLGVSLDSANNIYMV